MGEVKDEKKSGQHIATQIFIRTMGTGNNPGLDENYHKRLKRYSLFLALFPFVFLMMVTAVFYVLVLLLRTHVSVFILSGIFIIILIREIGTLVFSYRMRYNILKPLEDLQRGVEEIAGGNYGYTIETKVPTVINGLFRSFNKMSKELEEAERIKTRYELNRKELIAGISHDLKTPITSILGYVEGIHEGVASSPEKMDKYMEIIYNNAKYTNQLIDDLFLFSKLDINQMEYHYMPVGLLDYFSDIFVEKQIDLEEQGSKVTYSIDVAEGITFSLDPKMIHRVISNLISNAVKYNDKEQLELTLKASYNPEKAEVMVAIKDNGPGVMKEHLDQIFDVFYRVDEARSKDVGGSGLGLSISKQLIEAHGGDIWAASEENQGLAINFTLKDTK